jgi:hypothetical protein
MRSTLALTRNAVAVMGIGLVATTFAGASTVHAANAETIASVSQPSIGQGAQRVVEYLSGTSINLAAHITVSGTGVWASDEYPGYVDAQLMTVSPAAAAGTRDVTLINPDGTSTTCHGCLTVDPAPVLTSVVSSLQAGAGFIGSEQEGPVFLYGSGFSDSNAWFSFPTGMTEATDISSTVAEAWLAIPQGTAPGPYDVTYVNGDGGRARCLGCFTVLPGPVVTGMTPTSFVRGNQYPVTITGRHFDQGMMPFATVLHYGVTVSHVVVSADGTRITFDLRIGKKVYLNGSEGISLWLFNPAPGFGTAGPFRLNVTKSCGTTTC